MELNESQMAEIKEMFRKVNHGEIRFIVSPERDHIQCFVEHSLRIPVKKEKKENAKSA